MCRTPGDNEVNHYSCPLTVIASEWSPNTYPLVHLAWHHGRYRNRHITHWKRISYRHYHTVLAKTLRLILHDALPQQFHSIQCNLVNELTTCQGQGHSTIDNHIWGLQESFAHTNQFPSIPWVKLTKPPKDNKDEEEEVILIHLSPPPHNEKSTTTLSSNKLIVSASENPNIQLSEEINNLITCLK